MTPYEKAELLRAFDHKGVQLLIDKLDMLDARLQSVTKERDGWKATADRRLAELRATRDMASQSNLEAKEQHDAALSEITVYKSQGREQDVRYRYAHHKTCELVKKLKKKGDLLGKEKDELLVSLAKLLRSRSSNLSEIARLTKELAICRDLCILSMFLSVVAMIIFIVGRMMQ